MHLKILKKEQFKKQQKKTGNLIDNKIRKNSPHNYSKTSLTEKNLIEIPYIHIHIYIYIYIP